MAKTKQAAQARRAAKRRKVAGKSASSRALAKKVASDKWCAGDTELPRGSILNRYLMSGREALEVEKASRGWKDYSEDKTRVFGGRPIRERVPEIF